MADCDELIAIFVTSKKTVATAPSEKGNRGNQK